MKFVAILLLCSLTIAMVVAFPDNDDKNVLVPVDMQHVAALAAAADPPTSADQVSNSIRGPRHLLSKLFQPKTVVVQPVIVEQVAPRQYPGYAQPYPYYNQGGRYW
ncbi:uncharacterized protein LOC120445899 [Drosophila santomea]|uniref:uncharacterized protein LOC120445899 n=1 Tax=Drosophila santomea TaxID=129105 RepID=UPI00195385C7|nr:uncharacterized protein LOC120445899 [Drosophila santomea]